MLAVSDEVDHALYADVGADVLLTHAPPRAVGDREDRAHQGFAALHGLTARLQPSLLLHGHIHSDETPARTGRLGRTVVRNVAGRPLLDIEPGAGARLAPADLRYAR